ncbi:MAG: Rieske 2Fe-2S domain-containing protein [Phycisphaeraceae bacterium]
MSETNEQSEAGDAAMTPPRRSFMTRFLAVVFGTVVGVVPAIAGMMTLLDPLRRKSSAGELVPVTSLEALPSDGLPRKFDIRADLTDAWNKTPNAKIGAIYLKRTGPKEVVAFSTICPHAGCFVSAGGDGSFKCPCHDSEFNADGSVRPMNTQGKATVSPRGMDTLETQVTEDGQILVKFERFRTGSTQKTPQG